MNASLIKNRFKNILLPEMVFCFCAFQSNSEGGILRNLISCQKSTGDLSTGDVEYTKFGIGDFCELTDNIDLNTDSFTILIKNKVDLGTPPATFYTNLFRYGMTANGASSGIQIEAYSYGELRFSILINNELHQLGGAYGYPTGYELTSALVVDRANNNMVYYLEGYYEDEIPLDVTTYGEDINPFFEVGAKIEIGDLEAVSDHTDNVQIADIVIIKKILTDSEIENYSWINQNFING